MEVACLNINEAVNFAFKRLISSSTWTYTQIFALSAILAQCEIDYSCYRRWVGLMLVFMSLFVNGMCVDQRIALYRAHKFAPEKEIT